MWLARKFLCVFLLLFVPFVTADLEHSKGHMTVFCFLNGDLEPHTGNGSFEDCIPKGARCRAPTGELSQAINEINCTVPSYEKVDSSYYATKVFINFSPKQWKEFARTVCD